MADVNTNEDVTKTTENVSNTTENVSNTTENVSNTTENVSNTTENVAETAIAKLKKELEGKEDDGFIVKIINYMISRCKEDPPLAECVCQEHKTYEKCENYFNNKAMEYAKKRHRSGKVWIDDPMVYEWAEDYYRLDDKAEEERKAKEKAEREKAAAERAKKAKTAKKQEKSKPKKTSNAKTSSEPQKAKKNKNAIEGQTSLFDLM